MFIRIITDDFTSALDGSACFAQRGWDTQAITRPAPDSDATHQVISLDTDTRENPVARAGNIVGDVARAWRDADVLVVQFDSTLRGRVAHDCMAALAGSGRHKMLVVPAFPLAGRTTTNGCVLVDGVPVHETVFGRDPSSPVIESRLPSHFGVLGVQAEVASNASHAKTLLNTGDVVVVDAHSEADLDAIVSRFVARKDLLWAGSTGLLRALSRILRPPNTQQSDRGYDPMPKTHRPWLVVGSVNPCARRQRDVVQSQRRFVVVSTSDNRRGDQESPRLVLGDIVEETVTAIRNGTCDGLVVTGGETARCIIDALPALSIRICREVMPGVPLAVVRTANGLFPMIAKAGGFGDDNALLVCLETLAEY